MEISDCGCVSINLTLFGSSAIKFEENNYFPQYMDEIVGFALLEVLSDHKR